MPITDALRALALRSAEAFRRAQGDQPHIGEITRSLRDKFDPFRRYSYGIFQRIAERADRAYRAGRAMDESADQSSPFKGVPRAPASGDSSAKYSYRVVIVVTPADGGDEFSTAITVTSDRAMSPAEVRAEAYQAYQENRLERDYRSKIEALGDGPTIDIYIVGASRT